MLVNYKIFSNSSFLVVSIILNGQRFLRNGQKYWTNQTIIKMWTVVRLRKIIVILINVIGNQKLIVKFSNFTFQII